MLRKRRQVKTQVPEDLGPKQLAWLRANIRPFAEAADKVLDAEAKARAQRQALGVQAPEAQLLLGKGAG